MRPRRWACSQHLRRHLGSAAELARQRPFRAFAILQEAAEHLDVLGTDQLGLAGDLLDLRLAIDREEAHAIGKCPGDVLFLLDRVAERHAVGGNAGGKRLLDFHHGGAIEAGTHLGEQVEDLGRRVGLHGVENARVGQSLGESREVFGDDLKVDDENRAVLTSVAEELADAVGHDSLPTGPFKDPKRVEPMGKSRFPGPLWRRNTGNGHHPMTFAET